jgi:hypothetical protein
MADGIWIGGATKTLIRGQVQFPGSVAPVDEDLGIEMP